MQRARQSVYWPGMTNDVRNVVRTCKECQVYQSSQQRELMVQDPQPFRPGEAIAVDFFSCDGREYLVIMDKYSNWPEIYDFTRGVSTEDTVLRLLALSTTIGTPSRLTSNNGPQFKSEEFKQFCKSWGIEHDPSSPYHHEANGYAEAAVKSMKNLVKKICPGKTVKNERFFKALLEYRNIPRKDGLSPAQRLLGRPTRTKLPAHPVIYKKDIRDKIQEADRLAVKLRERSKDQHDRRARKLEQLEPGTVVRVQHHLTKRWDLNGTVMEVKPRGRSYLVRSETGRLYSRNRKFIRPYFPSEDKDNNLKRAGSDAGNRSAGCGRCTHRAKKCDPQKSKNDYV